jgi:hypothetical protein
MQITHKLVTHHLHPETQPSSEKEKNKATQNQNQEDRESKRIQSS